MFKVGATPEHSSVDYNRHMTTTAATGLWNTVNDYLATYPDTPNGAVG